MRENREMGSHTGEEKITLLNPPPPRRKRKGGLRTVPFIIVNESFERLASIGLIPNMIFYLMNEYHLKMATASIVLSLWSSLSNGLSIFGAVFADSYLGRYAVIVFGCLCSLLGMTTLWLTTMFTQLRPLPCENATFDCKSPSPTQLAVLILSFALISLGAGCNRPCSLAFGLDQLDDKENPNRKRLLQGFINWYNVATATSSVFALTLIVYIQDNCGWQVGFAIPALLVLFSALIFLLGSPFYIKFKASKSLLTGLFQVLVVAFKNRNTSLPPGQQSNTCFHRECGSMLIEPSQSLRCLNKACIIKNPEEDLNLDGSIKDPWSLCTVEQVESLKALIKIVPVWSTGIMLTVSLFQASFSTIQVKSMNRHVFGNFEIPAGSCGVVSVISLIIWLTVYDRFILPKLARLTGEPHGLSSQVRMGISLALSIVAMAVAATVEAMRRRKVIEQGLQDDPHASVDMSALWLIPQYVTLGVAEALCSTAHPEFFYAELPRKMASLANSLYALEVAMASLVGGALVNIVDSITSEGGKISWLASNINQGHIDYYYWLIGCLSAVNFLYFLICIWAHEPLKDERLIFAGMVEEDG